MSSSTPSITLSQFAGIRAALTEGHPLERVLAQEGVPAWRWRDLERELTTQVTSDPEAFARYAEDLERAENHLDRPVRPLDDDIAAWVGFLEAYRVGGQALLDRHALRATDVGRLQREWKLRLEGDDDLRREAERLTERPPPPPDEIQAAPGELRPFPWSPGAEEAARGRSLEPLLFLSHTQADTSKPSEVAVPFTGERPPPPPRLALEPSPEMGATAKVEDRAPSRPATPFEPTPVSPAPAPPAPAPPVSPPLPSSPITAPKVSALEPVAGLGMTAHASHQPLGAATPFAGSKPAPAPIASRLEPSPAMGATHDAHPSRSLEPSLELATTQAAKPRSRLEPSAQLGATVPTTPKASAPAVPFEGDKPAPPSMAHSLEPVPDLGMTKEAQPGPSPPLPFEGPSSETLPSEVDPAHPAPHWRVEEYGHYCAELDVYDDAAVRRRWSVRDEAHHRAIVAYWLEQFRCFPELRPRFAAALQAAAARLSR